MTAARAAILAIVAGCAAPARPCGPPAIWTVEATVTTTPYFGPAVHARAYSDGSIVVLFGTTGAVQLGDLQSDGPALGRIAPTGAVETLVHVAAAGVGGDLRVDDTGGIVVIWVAKAGVSQMNRYDRDFNELWSLAEFGDSFDIGPTGAVAYDFNTTSLRYRAPTGAEAWRATLPNAAVLRMADNGDLFAFAIQSGAPPYRRHYRADGTVLEDVPLPAITSSYELERDGSVVFIDELYRTAVTRLDANGTRLWSKSLRTSTSAPLVTATGDVAAVTKLASAIIRLDGATGSEKSEVATCHVDDRHGGNEGDPALVYVGADDYVISQSTVDAVTMIPSYAFAAYPAP